MPTDRTLPTQFAVWHRLLTIDTSSTMPPTLTPTSHWDRSHRTLYYQALGAPPTAESLRFGAINVYITPLWRTKHDIAGAISLTYGIEAGPFGAINVNAYMCRIRRLLHPIRRLLHLSNRPAGYSQNPVGFYLQSQVHGEDSINDLMGIHIITMPGALLSGA